MPTHKLGTVLRGQALGAFCSWALFLSVAWGSGASVFLQTGRRWLVRICPQAVCLQGGLESRESSKTADLGLWWGPLGALILDAGNGFKISKI